MGTRDNYYSTYIRDLDDWFKGLRPQCSIEVLIREDDRDRVEIYGAYTDSINIDNMKLIFTSIHGDKDTAVHLDSVTKVTINKENK